MGQNVDTCPKCGALITPNLSNCRQCGHYLHGTRLEGFLMQYMLPPALHKSPGTGVFFLVLIVYFVLMAMFAGPKNALGFTGYTLRQLGSTHSFFIYEGQLWRFVTSMLAHSGIVHLAFNVYALCIIGPLIEEAFDRKKMILITFVCGVSSMVLSHLYNVEIRNGLHASVGASGAVCGLLGACLVVARRKGPSGSAVGQAMLRWTVLMAIWSFMPGIDVVAHAGGWLVGAGLALITPMGLTQSVTAHRILSVGVLSCFAVMLLCVGLMLANLRGFPVALEKDAEPRRIFLFTIADGAPRDFSSQNLLRQDCEQVVRRLREDQKKVTDDDIYRCELAIRAHPTAGQQRYLAAMHSLRGNEDRAHDLMRVVQRFFVVR